MGLGGQEKGTGEQQAGHLLRLLCLWEIRQRQLAMPCQPETAGLELCNAALGLLSRVPEEVPWAPHTYCPPHRFISQGIVTFPHPHECALRDPERRRTASL